EPNAKAMVPGMISRGVSCEDPSRRCCQWMEMWFLIVQPSIFHSDCLGIRPADHSLSRKSGDFHGFGTSPAFGHLPRACATTANRKIEAEFSGKCGALPGVFV